MAKVRNFLHRRTVSRASSRHRGHMADKKWKAGDLAGIEYGLADHTSVGGREIVYEINTNPIIGGSLQKYPNELRERTLAHSRSTLVSNLFAIDSGDGTLVEVIPSDRVRWYRGSVRSHPLTMLP